MPKRTQETPEELGGGWRIAAEPAASAAPSEAPEPTGDAGTDTEPGEFSNVSVMLLGAFGGLYLLYTWGWFEVARAYSTINALTAGGSGAIGGVLQQIIFWVAPLAPAAWFFSAMLITRGKHPFLLSLALLVGALVLLPFPLLFGGAS